MKNEFSSFHQVKGWVVDRLEGAGVVLVDGADGKEYSFHKDFPEFYEARKGDFVELVVVLPSNRALAVHLLRPPLTKPWF